MIIKYKTYIDTWFSPKRFMRENILDYLWSKKGDKNWYIILSEHYEYYDKGSLFKYRKNGPAIIRVSGQKIWHNMKKTKLYFTEEGFWNV